MTPFGKSELDFMIMYFMRFYGMERVHVCAHLISIMLIYLAPWEAFAITKLLIERSAVSKRASTGQRV